MPEAPVSLGIIAIIRLRRERAQDDILEALLAGGVRTVEVTIDTPGALEAVQRWRKRNQALVGVGTVRTAEHAYQAIEAGAQFLVTPTTMPAVISVANQERVPIVVGALSPTEVDVAWQHGASAVKVFPVDAVGGPAYIRALQAPFPEVSLVPTGAVNADRARIYAGMRCVGVGAGSALVDERTVAESDWAELQRRAEALTVAWSDGQTS